MAGVTVTGQVTGQKTEHVTLLETGRAREWQSLESGLSWIFAIACLVASTTSYADILMGKVVGVSDGDTITVLDARQQTHKIRLSGIDAPEKAQPFGERAKQQLSDWVFQEQVQVIHDKVDRYGRIIGKVTKAGEDVNIQMVHAGLAWHYKCLREGATRDGPAELRGG